jgi:hypothetical protein
LVNTPLRRSEPNDRTFDDFASGHSFERIQMKLSEAGCSLSTGREKLRQNQTGSLTRLPRRDA